MVWLTERGVFALLRLDTDYFAAMYSYTITFGPFGPMPLRTSDLLHTRTNIHQTKLKHGYTI